MPGLIVKPDCGRVSRMFALGGILLLLVGCETPHEGTPSVVDEALSAVDFAPPPASGSAAPVVRAPSAAQNEVRQGASYFGNPGQPASRQTARAVRTSGGVQLNFEGADVREAVQVILRDVLGRNYVIDPAIAGEVVLSSSAPLSESELLTVLETILRMHGATMIDDGETVSVVVIGDTGGTSQLATLGGEEPPQATPGLGFTVVPLRFVTADAAAQFIQPLVTRPEQIRVDTTRNLLLFSGGAIERQTVLDTLRDVDVDWMAGRSVGIYPLAQSTPEAMIPELEALFGPLDPNGLRSETIRFLPMARLNAVLVIANHPEQLSRARTWIDRFDRGNTVGIQFYVYQLQHAPAIDMAKLLTESLSELAETQKSEPQPFDDSFVDPNFDAPFVEPTPGPAIGTTTLGAATSPGLLSTVKIVPNELNNTLLIRAAPQAYEMIEATLRRLDTAPLQVLIEATIAEVTLNDELRYGVQFFLNEGGVRAGFNTTTGPSGPINPSLLEPLAQVPGFNFVFTPGGSNITIDALERITDVKILSSPSLVVQDNSEAVLNVGDDVPIITRTATNIETTDGTVVNNVEYRSTGVILEVKPRISSNSTIAMEVSQEVSRVATETAITSDALTPTITQRQIQSTINILSGQTVVLGGLIQDTETSTDQQIPLLGDIPVLGKLFSSEGVANVRTELIVFITPRIITNAEDARDVSEELRSRMRSINPLPPARPGLRDEVPELEPSSLPPAQPQELTPTGEAVPPVAPGSAPEAESTDTASAAPVWPSVLPVSLPSTAHLVLGHLDFGQAAAVLPAALVSAPIEGRRQSVPVTGATSQTRVVPPELGYGAMPGIIPAHQPAGSAKSVPVPELNPRRVVRVPVPMPREFGDWEGFFPLTPVQRPIPGRVPQPQTRPSPDGVTIGM